MDDLGVKLDVVLEFVEGMKAQVMAIDTKLDSLTSAVSAMHADLKRLVGRPVLEVYKEWAERTKKEAGSVLPSEGTYRSFIKFYDTYQRWYPT